MVPKCKKARETYPQNQIQPPAVATGQIWAGLGQNVLYRSLEGILQQYIAKWGVEGQLGSDL